MKKIHIELQVELKVDINEEITKEKLLGALGVYAEVFIKDKNSLPAEVVYYEVTEINEMEEEDE